MDPSGPGVGGTKGVGATVTLPPVTTPCSNSNTCSTSRTVSLDFRAQRGAGREGRRERGQGGWEGRGTEREEKGG